MLEVRDLSIGFGSREGRTAAVRSLSFSVGEGETLAIVGESGSGKSVTALALTRLLPEPPAIYESGDIFLDGKPILSMNEKMLRSVRGNRIAYIFQEPATSLNPVYSIYQQIAETIRQHHPEVRDLRKEVIYWLDQVGIANARERIHDYPFQLSGGMQQRVMIAMALCCQPDILVADEPTTALDVTIQRQILSLFKSLKERYRMSMILITHNFGIIAGLADNVAVMFRGHLVEFGQTDALLRAPKHPYTRALIDCVPRLGAGLKRLKTIDYSQLPL
ncbi:MAG TPA: ABC transporter ATP-binding protein [Chthoniobacterales bacterium]|jgi:ABC-type dipeptide/oligopeptide/nickel transport system ATPase component|nr:ABC transporter ATP-binding protein [Chthoniobacterales bacterium]